MDDDLAIVRPGSDDKQVQGMPALIPIIQVNQWYEEGKYHCLEEHRATSSSSI